MTQTPPQIPPQLVSLMQAMATAGSTDEARALGGDPPVLDALAQPQSQVVEGVTLYANPCATYVALRLIRPFYPRPDPGVDADLEIDYLAGMAYCFAEPITAYMTARRGQDDFLIASMHWLGAHFTGPEAEFKLGRVVGWCANVLRVLDALNPRMPMPPRTQPASPVAASAPPRQSPDPTPA